MSTITLDSPALDLHLSPRVDYAIRSRGNNVSCRELVEAIESGKIRQWSRMGPKAIAELTTALTDVGFMRTPVSVLNRLAVFAAVANRPELFEAYTNHDAMLPGVDGDGI